VPGSSPACARRPKARRARASVAGVGASGSPPVSARRARGPSERGACSSARGWSRRTSGRTPVRAPGRRRPPPAGGRPGGRCAGARARAAWATRSRAGSGPLPSGGQGRAAPGSKPRRRTARASSPSNSRRSSSTSRFSFAIGRSSRGPSAAGARRCRATHASRIVRGRRAAKRALPGPRRRTRPGPRYHPRRRRVRAPDLRVPRGPPPGASSVSCLRALGVGRSCPLGAREAAPPRCAAARRGGVGTGSGGPREPGTARRRASVYAASLPAGRARGLAVSPDTWAGGAEGPPGDARRGRTRV